ncbi:MAG: DUF1232 domain-containing protein [Dehalococcoidia bacterium]|nr:DUF1232 domain-containing protein [Dehalococcoidia bacterium]
MPWYGWLVLSLGGFVALVVLGLRVLRLSRRGRRFLALGMRGKLRFGQVLLGDRGVPLLAKVVIVALVGYLALPFDLVPDFIPVAGQLDDALVITIAILVLLAAVPRDRFDAALSAAEAREEARRLAAARRADETRT